MVGTRDKTPEEIERLKKQTESTRFGQPGANPQSQHAGGNKPWSLRQSLRDMAHRQLDETDDVETMSEGEIIKKILPTKRPTLPQIAAARQLAKAAKGLDNSPQFVTEQIDGKLAQTNINADFAALQGMTDDELLAIATGMDTNTARRSESNTESPQGSTGDAAGSNGGDSKPTDPASV